LSLPQVLALAPKDTVHTRKFRANRHCMVQRRWARAHISPIFCVILAANPLYNMPNGCSMQRPMFGKSDTEEGHIGVLFHKALLEKKLRRVAKNRHDLTQSVQSGVH